MLGGLLCVCANAFGNAHWNFGRKENHFYPTLQAFACPDSELMVDLTDLTLLTSDTSGAGHMEGFRG